MQIPSASVLASWPPANHTNPQTRGPAASIVIAILLVLVTAILAIRVYARCYISRGFGLDDVLILLAYIPTASFAIILFVAQAKLGWGKHVWDVPFQNFVPSLQVNLASQLLFDLATTLTKLSMLALIYRVVSVHNSRWRYAVLALAAVVALDGTLFFFITTFQCNPVSAYWTLSAVPQNCINEKTHLLAAGCINTTTDFLIVLIPIPYVMRLDLPRKQQIIVAALFAGGVFVTAAGAVRTFITNKFISSSDPDLTYNSVIIILVSGLELFVGIICASIPPIKPFFALYVPRLLGNPVNWLSREGEGRVASGSFADDKALEPDFWLVTKRDSFDTFRDVESPSLVMQMQQPPPMPGMPTPMRPPRTLSTMRAVSIAVSEPPQPVARLSMIGGRPTSPSRPATAGTMATASASLYSAPNLNKPLPRISTTTMLDTTIGDDEGEWEGARGRETQMQSVYQFIPHSDGHISVRKARKSELGGG